MSGWRVVTAVVLGSLLGAPLLWPFARLVEPATWVWNGDDVYRIAHLALNTILLVGGTCLIAVPVGTILAVLLFRTSMPWRRGAVVVLVLLLFVPLPVIVSSWQGLLGSGGLLPIGWWASGIDRPWATGWGPAIWVHAVAAVPWVACIVGLGLAWVEPELEQTAALQLPPWRVVAQVTLPRCRASLVAATLFVALQTANEIGVTDMMLISTLAEEVYTQFTLGGEALGRTFLLALPALAGVAALVAVVAARLERALPPLPAALMSARPLLGRRPWLHLAAVVLIFSLLITPAAGLLWRLGEAGEPRFWSPVHAWNQLTAEGRLLGEGVLLSLGTALGTGVAVAVLALLVCWLARGSRLMQVFLLALLAAAWVAPGPVVGIGLKELILTLVQTLPEGPWDALLYFGPSPLPIVWAHAIRFLPAAVMFLWPVVRLVPRESLEAARLEGVGPVRELLFVIWPMTRRGVGLIGLAVAALALGEIAAAGRVETPGWESFARMLFDRMHYGVDSNVAALSVLLLVGVAVATLVPLAVWAVVRRLSEARPPNE
jgi:iron(III) transport system permease protein